MIHVCFGLYDKNGTYSKFTGTSMLSIFENISTPPISNDSYLARQHVDAQQPRKIFLHRGAI